MAQSTHQINSRLFKKAWLSEPLVGVTRDPSHCYNVEREEEWKEKVALESPIFLLFVDLKIKSWSILQKHFSLEKSV